MDLRRFADLKDKSIRELSRSGSPLNRSNRFLNEKDNNEHQQRAGSPVLKVNFFSPLDVGMVYASREKGKRSPRSNSPFYLNANDDKFTLPTIKLLPEQGKEVTENPYKKGLRVVPAADMFSRKRRKSPEPAEEKVTRKTLVKRFFSPKMFRATMNEIEKPNASKSPEKGVGQEFKVKVQEKMNKTVFWNREVVQEKTLVFGENYSTFATLVNIIFKRAASDPDLSEFFNKKNVPSIKQRFAELIVHQFNKNYKYEGRDLIEVHKRLNLRRKHFVRMRNIVVFSMVELNYSFESINTANKLIDSFRQKIVCSENLYEIMMQQNQLFSLQENLVEMLMNDTGFITIFKEHPEFWRTKHHTFVVKLALDNSFFIPDDVLRKIHVEAQKRINFNHRQFFRVKHNMSKCLIKAGFDLGKADECLDKIEEKRKLVLNQRSILEKLQEAKLFDAFLKSYSSRVADDKSLASLFVEFNEERLKLHHKAFLQFVLGSPNAYAKRDIYTYHKANKKSSRPIQITSHFQAAERALESTLREYAENFGITNETEIKETIEELDTYRNDVCVSEESIYGKIGGNETLLELVDRFYKKVLRAERISHFFSKTYINIITEQMRKFIEFAFGGDSYYRLEDIRSAHENLMVTEEEFDIFISIFDTTLVEMNILKKFRDEALERLSRYKSYICHEPFK